MNYRHFILREKLYPEEVHSEGCIPQQVCINCDYLEPESDVYTINKNKYFYEVEGMLAQKHAKRSSTVRVIFYVKDEKLALELAQRWVNEEKQKSKGFRVLGIDHYYSVFD